MKKTISTILVCVLMISTLFVLVSCGISGTYKSGATTVEFSGSKVTITDSVEFLGSVTTKTYEAKYKITDTDDGKQITFTYEEGADQHLVLNGTKTFSEGEKDGVKYIQIGLITYNKQ